MTRNSCGYCGYIHNGTCPRIKAIEYHTNGAVKRVEFHSYQSVPLMKGNEFDKECPSEQKCPNEQIKRS